MDYKKGQRVYIVGDAKICGITVTHGHQVIKAEFISGDEDTVNVRIDLKGDIKETLLTVSAGAVLGNITEVMGRITDASGTIYPTKTSIIE